MSSCSPLLYQHRNVRLSLDYGQGPARRTTSSSRLTNPSNDGDDRELSPAVTVGEPSRGRATIIETRERPFVLHDAGGLRAAPRVTYDHEIITPLHYITSFQYSLVHEGQVASYLRYTLTMEEHADCNGPTAHVPQSG